MQQWGFFTTCPLPQQDFRICSVNGLPVVSAPAEIDIVNVNQLSRSLLTASQTATAVVVADLTATTFIDASGLGALVRMTRWLEEGCVELRVVTCSERVRQLMAILGDDKVLSVFDRLDVAVTTKPRDWRLYHQAA